MPKARLVKKVSTSSGIIGHSGEASVEPAKVLSQPVTAPVPLSESASPVAASAPGAAASVPGELLVQFARGQGAEGRAKALEQISANVLETLRGPGEAPGLSEDAALLRVKVGAGLGVAKAIEILSRQPGVEFAEANGVATIQATSNDPYYGSGSLWGMYGDATGPKNIYGSQAGEAWAAGQVGSSKVVAGVIDSGIDYTHADLYLNVWLNQKEIPTALRAYLADMDGDGLITFRDLDARDSSGQLVNGNSVADINGNGRIDAGDLLKDSRWADGIDQGGNGYLDDLIGWDFANNDNDPYDDNNHGTHVSGTIGAVGGNGKGVAGVNWNTQVMALKFLGATGSGYYSGAIRALDYYTAASAADAGTGSVFVGTNNSWGGSASSTSLYDAIVRGAKQGAIFAAAAGNGGSDGVGDNNDSVGNFPANYSTLSAAGWEAVVSVGALTSSGALAGFSNYGNISVDLAAPGSGIVSTVAGGGYGSMSGTSMATPHVLGALALAAAARPGATAQERVAALKATTISMDTLASKTAWDGRLDIGALVASLSAPAATAPALQEPVQNLTLYGTTGSNSLVGGAGNDSLCGVPASGTHLGKGTVDRLTGGAGNDLFILGDARGFFYNDGSSRYAGTGDYALITDFAAGDRVQLKGVAANYTYAQATLGGVSGLGIYRDTNANRAWDKADELVGLVASKTTTFAAADLVFV